MVSVEQETNFGNDITLSPNPAGNYVEINTVMLHEGYKEAHKTVVVYDLLGIKYMDSRLPGNDIFVS